MFNDVIDKFRTEEKAKKFAEDSGLTPQTAFYLFMSQLIAVGLTAYESVFKTSLLFFIDTFKQNNMTKTITLNPLLDRIEQISPKAEAGLKKMINPQIRNSLAHGTFWFDYQTIYLATNSHLEKVDEMNIRDFWMEIFMNIIAHALIDVIGQKKS